MSQQSKTLSKIRGEDAIFLRNLKRRFPVVDRGEGIYLTDQEGKQYMDFAGGAVVVSIGYGVEEVIEAMARQAGRISFAHGSQFSNQPALDLAERLAAILPGDLNRLFFVSGGSEATETALKLARQYQVERGKPEKYKIISRWHSYHGATLGAVSMSGMHARRAPYEPLLLPFPHIEPAYCYRCPFGKSLPDCGMVCAEALESTIEKEGADTIAAFIAEPVVGAALGAVSAPEGYFRRIREICDRHDILWIADEVMTGMGRTGRNFGVERDGARPDLMALAKGLSSGYAPLGAVAVSEPIFRAIMEGSGAFVHGYTYSQHPASCAAALAVMDYMEKHNLVQRAAEMGRVFLEKLTSLQSLDSVGDVRGEGMMLGVEFVEDKSTKKPFPVSHGFAQRVYEEAFARGLVLYPGGGSAHPDGGDHLLLGPHFITTEAEAEEMVSRLGAAIAAAEKSLP